MHLYSAPTQVSNALFGLDLSVHLELFCDLFWQHLTEQRVSASFLGSQLHRLQLKLLSVFSHFAQHISQFSGVPQTQSKACQRDQNQ